MAAQPHVLSRSLVLGAGGPVGRAWQLGLLAQLVSRGWTFAQADLILGTSAGAVVGCRLAARLELGSVLRPVEPSPSRSPEALSPELARLLQASVQAARSSRPEPYYQDVGRMALGAETMSESASIHRLGLPSGLSWPQNFRAIAVNAGTGVPVQWSRDSGVDLVRAVASSAALPSVAPAITIDGQHYMDGGVRSMLNADLATGHQVVTVLSCFDLSVDEARSPSPFASLTPMLNAEVDKLRREGAHVEVISPSEQYLELTAFGVRMLDYALVPDAARLGATQGASLQSDLADYWT